jgi:hypothetical protein
MMRKFRMWVLALAAAGLWTTPARPADKDKDEEALPGVGAVEIMLLRQHSVREDMKIGDKEATRINDFASRQWKKAQELDKLSGKEQDEKFDALAKENEKFLDEILKPEQRKRLNQITMQLAGLLYVTKPEIAAELKLTDDQKKKAHELQQEAHKEAQAILRSNKDREVKKEQLEEMRMANRKRLMGLLTDDQKAKWKAMAGEPFKGELNFSPPKETKP